MTSRLSIAKDRLHNPDSPSKDRKRGSSRKEAGKSRARRKTLRHGLAAITRHNPRLFPDIERMAKAICNGDTNPLLVDQALSIAENEILLRCVRLERIAVIERLRDKTATPLTRRNNSLARAKTRFRKAKFRYKLPLRYKPLLQIKAKNPAIDNKQGRNSPQQRESEATQPIRSRDEFDAMRLAMPDLDRLARYERRAWSRRKRADRDFITIKSMRVGESKKDCALLQS
jgi:hypothetical protein